MNINQDGGGCSVSLINLENIPEAFWIMAGIALLLLALTYCIRIYESKR